MGAETFNQGRESSTQREGLGGESTEGSPDDAVLGIVCLLAELSLVCEYGYSLKKMLKM